MRTFHTSFVTDVTAPHHALRHQFVNIFVPYHFSRDQSNMKKIRESDTLRAHMFCFVLFCLISLSQKLDMWFAWRACLPKSIIWVEKRHILKIYQSTIQKINVNSKHKYFNSISTLAFRKSHFPSNLCKLLQFRTNYQIRLLHYVDV